jgi:hypothetical protein
MFYQWASATRPVCKPLTTTKGVTMEDLIDLVMAANNVDISFIDGQFHIHVIEKSGKLHLFKVKDLPWGIHNIRDELLD